MEIISGREQSVVWVYEDGSVHGGSTSRGVSGEALVAVETEKRQGSIGGQISQELQIYELSGNVFSNEGNVDGEELEGIEPLSIAPLVGHGSQVPSMSWNKGIRELKRLNCSVNYDKKGGQSSSGGGKGRGSNGVL